MQASIERQGGQGIVRVELDPGRTRGGAERHALGDGDDRAARRAPSTDSHSGSRCRGSARIRSKRAFPLQKAGVYLGAVQLGTGAVLPLAPLTASYSPEFEPRLDPEEGRKTLSEMARVTGGVERTTLDDVFDAGRCGTVRSAIW